ncbi:urease accessory protein UreF [Bacillus weihaiensis]|uniref:Urease accessory protein UreF n=1 Tax=Bacillus weihaiensis TaxID=1547283 RepID=A0A1L3MQ76_9BACI|nr:urease accessory protein UreF [Bacillus weihaiensis]APH04498.1 urease accessory protein UreF [Bacillus weihaiensis]
MANKQALFHLLQICDSNFPSGAFSHSFGLETYIQENKLTNKQEFYHALTQYLSLQFIYTDGLACKMVYEAIKSRNIQKVWEIDQELYALSLAKETREGNRRIGRQLVKVMNELYEIHALKDYQNKIKRKEAFGHSAIVFAMVSQHLQLDVRTALETYLFATTSSLVQNAVRGIPLGQTDGQRVLIDSQPFLTELVDKTLLLDEADFGASSIGLEIAQMIHEQLPVRLFMS